MNLHFRRELRNLPIAVLSIAVLGSSARAETLTLNEALATAYETNTQLEAQRAALRAVDEDVAT